MKVNDFYQSLFWSLGLTTDPDNNDIVTTDFDDNIPITISGKKLALPTKANLKSPDFDSYVYFHPLSEDILSSAESKVSKRLRKLINVRLNKISIMLANELLNIAADTKRHKELRPDQHQLIQAIPKADVKATRDFDKVTKRLMAGDEKILEIYVKPNGTFRGNKCSRTTIVSFFFDKDDEESLEFMGVPIGTRRDKKTILDLFKFIFNNQGDEEFFNFGSNDATAPYFHALLGGFMRVGGRINELIRLFDNLLTDGFKEALGSNFKPVFSWEVGMSSFVALANEIPPLPDNTGSDEKAVTKVNTQAVTKREEPVHPHVKKAVSISEVLAQREEQTRQPQQRSFGSNHFGNQDQPEQRFGGFGGGRGFGDSGGFSNNQSGFGGGFDNNSFGSGSRRPSIKDINVDNYRANSWGRN